jgi:hypothetical protein
MRPFSKRRYLFAFIITTAIFFLGFFFGFLMDLQRVDYFQSINDVNKLNIRSLELQNDLVRGGEWSNQCNAMRFMFDKAITELETNRDRLETYDHQSKVRQSDFDTIKREYVLSQINFWEIARNLKVSCPNSSDFISIIYFFSSKEKCPDCTAQAPVLNYYKEQLKENLLIFSIDEQFESQEPLITLLKTAYGVDSYPTLLIQNTTYRRLVGKEEMADLLCSLYQSDKTRSVVCAQ